MLVIVMNKTWKFYFVIFQRNGRLTNLRRYSGSFHRIFIFYCVTEREYRIEHSDIVVCTFNCTGSTG